MSNEEIVQNLAWLMDTISECEGALAIDADGNLIEGQTILERDVEAIAEKINTLLNAANEFDADLEKGATYEIIVGFEGGFLVIHTNGELTLGGLLGEDGRLQMSLLSRSMKRILDQ